MKNKIFLFLIPLLISGCSNSNSNEGEKKYVDCFDRTISVKDGDEKRAICLGAGALRLYSYVGNLSYLVGVEKIDNEPFGVGTALRPYYHVNKDYFKSLDLCGVGGPLNQSPDYEAILSVRPTIIYSEYSSASINDEISSRLNIPVVSLSVGNNGTFDDMAKKSLRLIGDISKNSKRAESLISYIEKEENNLKTLLDDVTQVSAYVGCIGNWGKTNIYGTYLNYPVLNYANVKNDIDILDFDLGSKQVSIDAEKLNQINPSRIFLDGAGLNGFLSDYKENKAKYEIIDAFKNDEIYVLLPYNAYYVNLEIQIMSTYYVASISYPHKFIDFNIDEKCDEILKNFLDNKCYDELKKYNTAYGGYSKINIGDLING